MSTQADQSENRLITIIIVAVVFAFASLMGRCAYSDHAAAEAAKACAAAKMQFKAGSEKWTCVSEVPTSTRNGPEW